MQGDDSELVRAAADGNGDAFEALLERHYDRVFRIAYRVLGNQAEAEDTAQDVCLALPDKLRAFRGEARFTTWLTTLVMNAARDRLRRRATAARASQNWGEVEHLRRAEAQSQAAELSWLTQAMTRLEPELRETVALVVGEEMTHRAAAEVLGIAEGTVSWRMGEVKKALRALAADAELEERRA